MSEQWTLENNAYDPQKDNTNTIDRRKQTTIFRLRTGHCGLRKHIKGLVRTDSAHCDCSSEKQAPRHILRTWARMHHKVVGNFRSEVDVRSLYYRR